MSRLTRDGTAEHVSRDQILRRERGQENFYFPCSADHEQDWQHFPYFCTMCGLEKLGLIDQNWLERNLSASLLRTLVVGRRQQSESIEAALDME